MLADYEGWGITFQALGWATAAVMGLTTGIWRFKHHVRTTQQRHDADIVTAAIEKHEIGEKLEQIDALNQRLDEVCRTVEGFAATDIEMHAELHKQLAQLREALGRIESRQREDAGRMEKLELDLVTTRKEAHRAAGIASDVKTAVDKFEKRLTRVERLVVYRKAREIADDEELLRAEGIDMETPA